MENRKEVLNILGKTHFKVGILFYSIFSLIPSLAITSILSMNTSSLIICLVVAGTASLLPDLDCSSSMVYNANPIGKAVANSIGLTQKIISRVTYFALLVIAAAVLHINKTVMLKFLHNAAGITISPLIFYCAIGLLCIAAVVGPKTAPFIPVLGWLYMLFEYISLRAAAALKRVLLSIVYLGAAAYLIFYNLRHSGDFYAYVAAALIIAAVIFPHRTLLHSLEGFTLFSCAFYHFLAEWGLKQAGIAFIVGYGTHLYLCDIFTDTGVPLSALGYLLRIMPWHTKLLQKSWYSKTYAVLSKKLKLPIIKTGSTTGRIAETLYVLCLCVVLGIMVFSGFI